VIGTWNVKTLLKPGKMQELSEELYKTQLKSVALQEIRWAGSGVISKKDFQLFYSGTQKSGQAGTGFYVQKEIAKHIVGFEAVSERICKFRIKGKYSNIILIMLMLLPKIMI
jgi:exonuclease III